MQSESELAIRITAHMCELSEQILQCVVRDIANRLAPTLRHYSDIFMPPASTVLWIGWYSQPLFALSF